MAGRYTVLGNAILAFLLLSVEKWLALVLYFDFLLVVPFGLMLIAFWSLRKAFRAAVDTTGETSSKTADAHGNHAWRWTSTTMWHLLPASAAMLGILQFSYAPSAIFPSTFVILGALHLGLALLLLSAINNFPSPFRLPASTRAPKSRTRTLAGIGDVLVRSGVPALAIVFMVFFVSGYGKMPSIVQSSERGYSDADQPKSALFRERVFQAFPIGSSATDMYYSLHEQGFLVRETDPKLEKFSADFTLRRLWRVHVWTIHWIVRNGAVVDIKVGASSFHFLDP